MNDPVPRICVGASGEQINQPLVGRLADMWNGSMRGTDDDWRHRLGIVHAAADFGHPQSTEPVLRFVEQVMKPLRA